MAQILCNSSFIPGQIPYNPDSLIEFAIRNLCLDNIIIVVPTGKLVRNLKNKAVRVFFQIHKKPVGSINFFTFDTFVHHIFSKINKQGHYRLISDAYKLAIMEEAAEKADLKFFIKSGKKISAAIIQRLANVVYGLKEDGITVENLLNDVLNAEKSNDATVDIQRLKDVFELYKSYQELLGGKLLDRAELLRLVIDYFKNNEKQAPSLFDEIIRDTDKITIDAILPNKPVIMFNGFSEFKSPELEFISLFSKCAVLLAVNIDFSTRNGPLFGNLEENILRLLSQGFKLYPLDTFEDRNQSHLLKNTQGLPRSIYLRRWLFNTEADIKSSEFSSIIKVLAAESRIDEVRTISRLIRELSICEGIPLSDICIAMRQPEQYSGIFREMFTAYNIPANISDRYSLSKSPICISVFAVLDIVLRGFRREDVHRALRSSYLTFQKTSINGINSEIDGANLFDAALSLRIISRHELGGAELWKKRLNGSVASMENRLKELETDSNIENFIIVQAKNSISSLKKALEDFKILCELLPWKNRQYTPLEFSEIIKKEILGKFKVKDNILKFHKYLSEKSDELTESEKIRLSEELEKDSRAFSTFLKLLDEMVFIISDRYPGKKFKLEEYVKRLKTAVGVEKFQIHEKQSYGVTVTSIEQTRSIPYKIMFLCGASDGEFPMAYRPETFLGKELGNTYERHNSSERIQYYQFLTNNSHALDDGSKQIYITYPKYRDTEELVRSQFVDELLKITTLEQDNRIYDLALIRKEKDNPKADANIINQLEDLPWLNSIANESEYLQFYSDELFLKKTNGYDNIINDLKTSIITEKKRNNRLEDNLQFIESYLKERTIKTLDGSLDLNSIALVSSDLKIKTTDVVSISDLETYAACPFKYFIQKILRFEDRELPDLTLSPLELGNVYHTILYRFYSELQNEILKNPNEYDNEAIIAHPVNKSLRPIALVNLEYSKYEDYKKLLFKIAKEEIDCIRFEHPFFELEEQEIFGSGNHIGYLELWLQQEFARIESGWQFAPALFEFGFGMSGRQQQKSSIPEIELVEGLKLRGKIDRIEFIKTDEQLLMMVADYKSSDTSVHSNNEINDKLAFQMPLYLAAARIIMKDYYSLTTELSGGVYYILKPTSGKKSIESYKFILLPPKNPLHSKNGKNDKKQKLPSDSMFDEILENSIDTARSILYRIEKGEFPVAPADKNKCKYCNYPTICRINEKQIIEGDDIEDS